MARLLKQFEGEYLENDDLENLKNIRHHEQGLSGQKPSRDRFPASQIPSDKWVNRS